MAPIKIDHIISFSSEDPVHIANNILSTDTNKKWKCRAVGEKQAIVVLQLEKASQITAIDIGNENSAYVEVLVSRSSNSDDYKVLLVTSSFMTPIEARQSNNVNKVRMFTQDHLSKPECQEKWDRVKIVCTQPFNKHVQFGLSFITLHSNESKVGATSALTKIGNFAIRPKSPDNLYAGNIFAKRKEYKLDEKPITAAAAIRDASSNLSQFCSPPRKQKLICKDTNLTPKPTPNKEEPTRKDRNREELFYDEDDKKGSEKIDRIMKKKEEEDKLKQKDAEKGEQKRKRLFEADDAVKNKKNEDNEDKTPQKRSNLFGIRDEKKNETPHKRKDDSPSNIKRKKKSDVMENKKPKKAKMTKPFNKLLDGVVLVISGIQNPDRANLRTMALSMGAKYKADWDTTCTHLICAFLNTPKFNQVKGKGKIITRSWVESCHSERKRLPWRRFALDKVDAGQTESDEEIEELIDIPSASTESPIHQPIEESDDEHKAKGSDTEERVARILEKKKKKEKQKKRKSSSDDSQGVSADEAVKETSPRAFKNLNKDEMHNHSKTATIFDIDTDDEPDLFSNHKNPSPNIFRGDKFYVDHTFDEETYNTLCKYIKAYNGKCTDDVTDDINVIITKKENSSTLKEVNGKAKCVKQTWILESHNKQKMLPIDDFIL